MPKNINSIAINITLEDIEKIKTEKKPDENQFTIYQMKLARNYKILTYGLPKIEEDIKEQFDKAYLQVLKLIVQWLNR